MNLLQPEEITVVRYDDTHRDEWDKFVSASRNGTFLHLRNYMDYHKERFADYSLMFYVAGCLTAVLPAHIKDDAICSHRGLTYGGFLLAESATATNVLAIFDSLKEYVIQNIGVTKLLYAPVPHIYHKYPCEEDLYALFRNKATLVERKISSTIRLSAPITPRGRRKLTSACKNRMTIVEDNDFVAFWEILDSRLLQKYNTSPVHAIGEIELLHRRFPQNIRLIRVTDSNGETLCGVVMYITDNVAHVQYTATSEEGRRIGAADYLYQYTINSCVGQCEYFDFGISVENGGEYLNSGLISHKERLGGRATMYDTYCIELTAEK